MVTFRKSKTIAGIRWTITPRGVSGSAGPKGARVSANSRGEVRRTLSIPGSGIYDTKRIDGGRPWLAAPPPVGHPRSYAPPPAVPAPMPPPAGRPFNLAPPPAPPQPPENNRRRINGIIIGVAALFLLGMCTVGVLGGGSDETTAAPAVASPTAAATASEPAAQPTTAPAAPAAPQTTAAAPAPPPVTTPPAQAPPPAAVAPVAPADPAQQLDPQFSSCTKANAAGFGNYVRGQDPEYAWYDDRDDDGIVCETG